MSRNTQFTTLARKAYLSYHQDGLLDLLIGWGVLAFGLMLATDSSVWALMGWLPIVFYVPLKNRFTVPRLGYVKFKNDQNKIATGVLVIVLLIISVLGIALFLFADSAPSSITLWIRDNSLLFYGLVGAFGFGLTGLGSGIRRILGYSLLSLLIMLGGHLLGVQEFLPFLLLGGVILVVGLFMLTRFLRKYPLSSEGEVINADK